MKRNNIIYYSHGGSANHGCEAIVRSSIKIMSSHNICKLLSNAPNEDSLYGIDKLTNIEYPKVDIKRNKLRYLLYLIRMKLLKSDSIYYNEIYRDLIEIAGNTTIAISVGGDNYCYKGFIEELRIINRKFNLNNIKTVLWGCSIEPELLSNSLINDLNCFKIIIARESITYNALITKGLKNVKLYPDPAFQLDRIDKPLPDGFIEGNSVGINVSPMIIGHEKNKGVTLTNYIKLIEHIINNSDMQIVLIPHVVWIHNDDRKPLKQLYDRFSNTGRVIMIEDHNAMELKGYIARCRFFVAARTHASVAAYSEHVPTLVVGYSVKARGIARDIFGSDDKYVISVQSLEKDRDLTDAFRYIVDNEAKIKANYALIMDRYKIKAADAAKEIDLL